ncbi:hypothetical protein MSHI_18600 [Mycobacterium shinjukuense]|uniref:Uncharacterized protein n=1 Tax=Mycobacterium shinjukuense TaxID=398694 RepID=A0A7I7MNX2_9MYCO|nr:hypothetical protein MSHI_18600 [Mycobacterium shinjukuense]
MVALELSCRICAACGEGAPDVTVAAEVPVGPAVGEVAVVDFFPQPVMTVAKSAVATKITIDPRVTGGRELRRWELCACAIKPFMASLC